MPHVAMTQGSGKVAGRVMVARSAGQVSASRSGKGHPAPAGSLGASEIDALLAGE